jgi:hypothetical protein
MLNDGDKMSKFILSAVPLDTAHKSGYTTEPMEFELYPNSFRAQNTGQNLRSAIAIIISIQGEGVMLL